MSSTFTSSKSAQKFSADIKTQDGQTVEEAQNSDRPDKAVCTYKQTPG